MTIRRSILLAVACILLSGISMSQVLAPDTTRLTYDDDIRWALVRTCFECHSGKESRGGLLVDSYDALMEGGENGPSVVPGSAEKSILFQKLQPNPPFGKMMPRKKDLRLSAYEIEMIRSWIQSGAARSRPIEKEPG